VNVAADPWVMYLVVRKDHPLTVARAMSLAGAGVVRCADRFRGSERWAEAFRAWGVRPRKVALRADAEQIEELRATLDCEAVETEMGVTLLALPPRRRSQAEPLLTQLRPYTDPPRVRAATADPEVPAAPDPHGRLVYVVRPGVLRTAGKAMAQAGHAALMCADRLGPRYPEAFAAWRARGAPGDVRVADLPHWAALRESPGSVVVTDAGLTQVEPGTETVIAFPPLPEPPPLVRDLPPLRA
jgi:peptidyl-tRNA hydrolase